MIAHLRGREEALEPFGWSQEDTEWVAMVCLNSGMFTRSQYTAYFHAHHSRAQRFVQSLVDFKLAVEEPIPVIRRMDRTQACRITHKSIYRELGVPNIRHRRNAGLSVYLRRLLSLDYVIEHPELEWLPTEEEKVFYCTGVGVSKNQLPKRIYGGSAGSVSRYFHLKLPIAGGPATTFVYVDPANGTSTELRYWGWAHQHVWSVMRERASRFMWPQSESIPTPTTAREPSWRDGRTITRGPTAGVTVQAPMRQSCRRKSTNFPGRSTPLIPRFSDDLEVSPEPGRATGHCGAWWQTPRRPPSGLTPSRYGDPGVFIRPVFSSTRRRNEIELCGFFQRVTAPIRPSNPGRTLSKIGHPLRSRKAAPACAKQNGYCCARPLRTAFAQGLCARPLRIFYFPYRFCSLAVRHCARSFPVQHQRGCPVLHQRGGPVLHQRGSKWRERPPRLRTSCGSDPRMHCASRGPVPPSLPGGRSRHNDPCGKARIAEG